MGKFADLLATMRPSTGNRITKRGTLVNIADVAEQIESSFDIFNQLQTVEYTPLVGQKPLPGLSFLRDKLVPDSTGFSVVGGEVRIDGTLAKRELYTKDYGLYIPGLLGLAGIRPRFDNINSGTYEYGYGNGDGNRTGISIVNGAASTFVESEGVRWYSKPRAEWLDPLDGTGPSGITADLNGATLRIVLAWYGGLSILFTVVIADRINGDKKVLIDSSGNRDGDVTLAQPDLPIFAEANGGIMYVGGRQYGVLGRYVPQTRITSTRKVSKAVSETLTPIVSMRPKSATRWLSVPITLDNETVTCNKNAEYVIIIGGTLTAATFGNIDGIDQEETAMEVDTAATAVTGGYRAPGDLIIAGQGNNPGRSQKDVTNVNIPAGTIVTLALLTDPGQGAGTATAIMRIRENW